MTNLKSLILLVFIPIMLSACNNPNPAKDQKLKSTHTKSYHSYGMEIDTAFAPSSQPKELSYWADYSEFYSVYKINPELFGIALDVETNENPFQELLNRYSIDDSIASFPIEGGIYKNPYLTKKLLSHGPEQFFVYCERGRTTGIIDSVWYSFSECTSSLIFKISLIDTLKYGKPLIASKKKLELQYRKLEGFDKALYKSEGEINNKIDFPDEDIHSIQFAHNKEYVLTYKDNFTWFKPTEKGPGINSPGRDIFRLSAGKVKCIWASYLDVIGIPCI